MHGAVGESLANGEAHNGSEMEPKSSSMEPIRLPYSPAKPFGTLSSWPAFGSPSAGLGAPPQSPVASPARSNSSAASGERRAAAALAVTTLNTSFRRLELTQLGVFPARFRWMHLQLRWLGSRHMRCSSPMELRLDLCQ